MKSFDFGGEVSLSESQDCYVYNNILFARDGKNVALEFDSTGTYWNFNVMHNGPLFNVTPFRQTIYSNPNFRFGTLRLRADSPAVNSAFTTPVYPFDIDGFERTIGGALDMGAAEYTPGFDD
jgi:hypothetical protein